MDAEDSGRFEGEKAPATFFVIGSDANDDLGLLKREYNEGHEIGNHTYTHPRWNDTSRTQIDVEPNVTQRLLSSTLGVKTLLFRPPYGIDHQPEADEVGVLPDRAVHGLYHRRRTHRSARLGRARRGSACPGLRDRAARSGASAFQRRKHRAAARWRRRPFAHGRGPAANYRWFARGRFSDRPGFGAAGADARGTDAATDPARAPGGAGRRADLHAVRMVAAERGVYFRSGNWPGELPRDHRGIAGDYRKVPACGARPARFPAASAAGNERLIAAASVIHL